MRSLLPVSAIILAATAIVSGCGGDKQSYVPNVGDGYTTPTMTTTDVETFISDSGYTRYHISTPLWQMFENADEPFWRFPEGMEMEQYDEFLRPASRIVCDSATYFSRKRIWRLDGNVVMVNTLRDSFLTRQLFWEQATRKIRSDSFIHIVRSDRIIEGYGFESNENMTSYIVNRPTGIIPVERNNPADDADAVATDTADTAEEIDSVDTADEPAPGRRAAPTRASVRRPAPATNPGTGTVPITPDRPR